MPPDSLIKKRKGEADDEFRIVGFRRNASINIEYILKDEEEEGGGKKCPASIKAEMNQ